MKLFEMKPRPSEAGLAKISYEKEYGMPTRNGADIALINDPEAEFFPLCGGEQFLFRRISPDDHNRGRGHEFWFGGTDELPFLVRLKADPFNHFMSIIAAITQTTIGKINLLSIILLLFK